ncbi:MmgE/PrpD family protein [Aliiroseovarius subalbicans]|uniref:MmgE/PrpD family protein n=1 Tax=Aliiroseovarius subalbicans TaxID=2925840 RepID=UPI001F5AB84E|nr:MmgE/PrpD family protein [Aliiroseovarius subalbicans]MCI2398270.1 MmgE/PrpD family protein [Aliiroseovarius subalbicans]
MSALAGQLAAFALGPLRGAEDATEMMRLSLLDWCAVGIAGRAEPVSCLLRDHAGATAGQGPCAVFGGAQVLPPATAALVNGTISHALDYDDTHFAHIGHPSVAVLPAAFALAQATGADGDTFLEAALAGVEGSIRIGQWLGRGHYQIGFHQTATAGAFGATLAAARLLALTPDQTGHALGIAATRAAGLKSQFGTMGKPYHAGLAAQTGVEAAQLAQAGFLSNPDALDGPQGFGPTHAGAGDLGAFDGLNRDWMILSISHKFHACCHGTHAMLEALAEVDLPPAQVDRIRVATHPRWLSVCNIATPTTGLEVKFSYRQLAAMAIRGVPTGALDSYTDERAQDLTLRALAQRVVVEGDDSLPETACRVQVNGTDYAHDLDAPITLPVRRDKLLHKAAALIGPGGADALWAQIQPASFIFPEISSPKA